MRLARRAAAAGLLCATGLSCSLVPRIDPQPGGASDGEAELAYRRVLERWTRQAQVYQGLDSRLFLGATLESAAFRAARVERQAAFRAQPASEREALLAGEREAHARSVDLTVGLFANERRFDDLGSPSSIWRVVLVTDAGEAAPDRVERVARPDANLRALYPFVDFGWTVYRLRFERTRQGGPALLPPGASRVTLRVASALGRADLTWDLPAPGADPAAWP